MAKMVKCKSCQNEIAKTANPCPVCGAKRGLLKTHPILGGVMLFFLIMFFIGIIVGTSSSDEPTGESVGGNETGNIESVEHEENTTYTIGESATLEGITVTMTSAKEIGDGELYKPESGNTFINCEFEIENNSNSDIAISSMLSFEAYVDDYSISMSLAATIADGGDQLDGTIAAGKKMKGVIGYEVPEDWEIIEIRFTPDFWTFDDIIFIAKK